MLWARLRGAGLIWLRPCSTCTVLLLVSLKNVVDFSFYFLVVGLSVFRLYCATVV